MCVQDTTSTFTNHIFFRIRDYGKNNTKAEVRKDAVSVLLFSCVCSSFISVLIYLCSQKARAKECAREEYNCDYLSRSSKNQPSPDADKQNLFW